MAKKKKRFKFKKIILLFLLFVLIIGFIFTKKLFKKEPVPTEALVIDTIDNFSYQLNDNETKYYNELFNSLKELLSTDDYNEDDYAVIIAKLFLADFYDLDSKLMKSDIGGTQFVYEQYRTDFELGAINSLYKSVESNVYGDRKQKLPVVKNVEMVNLTKGSFAYNDSTDNNAYYLDMSIDYEKDLGYPTNVKLILIHVNDKLEIASME